MNYLSRAALGAIAAVALSAPAAAVVTFTAVGAFEASWTLPASPTPDVDLGSAFRIDNVAITFNGAPVTTFIEFYSEGGGGGACADDFCSLFDLYGPALFSGTTAAPTFLLGTFSLNQGSVTGPAVRLTISEAGGPAIPEPATWAMMIAGFGMVGFAARRRTRAAHA